MGEEIVVEEEKVNISLKDLSNKLEEFAKARDWEKYHSPRNLLLAMVIFFLVFCFWVSLHVSLFCLLEQSLSPKRNESRFFWNFLVYLGWCGGLDDGGRATYNSF